MNKKINQMLDNGLSGDKILIISKMKGKLLKQMIWVLLSVMFLPFSAFPFNFQNDYLVTISAVSTSSEGKLIEREQYKAGEKIQVKVTMVNTSSKTLNVPKGEDYYRPQLFRDGQLVAYRKEVFERIEKQDKGDSSRITGFLFLKPNEAQSDVINLDYWYEPLPSGHYQLSLQRIFFKQRVESNVIFFEVASCK